MEATLKVKLLEHTPNPDMVVAKAAKLCYSKIGIDDMNVTEEEATKFVDKLMGMGHCYDENTEVLTSNGFVKWEDITEYDLLASFNPYDSSFNKFEKPSRLISRKINEDIIVFSHKYASLAITDNHRLYTSISNTTHRRINPSYELRYASELLPSGKYLWESPMRMKATAVNSNINVDDLDSLYKLYGFFVGDGYARPNSTEKSKNIDFHLRLDRKIEYLKNICNELGLDVVELNHDKYKVILDGLNLNMKIFREMFYSANNEKTFPIDFFRMSKNQFNCFIEGLLMSDGHYSGRDKNDLYFTTSHELADRLQVLCSLNNRICTIHRKSSNSEVRKEVFKLYIHKEGKDSLMFNDSRAKHNKSFKQKYDGYVYCATVSTGLLMIRRNGKVLLSGNCSPIEHVSFTFAIEGVSRALTHQLVRHRIASYSQQSQRYVKLAQFEYIVPPKIKACKKAYARYVKHMEDCQAAYDEIYDSLLIEEAQKAGVYSKYMEYVNKQLLDIYKVKSLLSNYSWDQIKSYDDIQSLDAWWASYDKTLERKDRIYLSIQKTIIEDARYVFPNACETKICATMNARTLLNFFHHRCCERAQWEIRNLADHMYAEVINVAPAIFSKAGPNCVSGPCPEGAMSCGKVKEMREKYVPGFTIKL